MKYWDSIKPSARVRSRANRLLRLHPLRASDAFQLAAAILAAAEDTASLAFVCDDQRLGEAARREGFRVL